MTIRDAKRVVAALAAAALVTGCCFLKTFERQAVRPVTYRTHSSIPAHWIPAINSAHASWNVSWNMFNYGGGGGSGTFANDGINSIFMFAFLNPFILAGVQRPGMSGCSITDTDMGWSTGHVFSTTGANIDVQTVAVHELGHYGRLQHVSCPSNAVMFPAYTGLRRNLTGCDAFGMFVANLLPTCFPAMGICFPSFFGFSLNAFDALEQQDQQTVSPFEVHTDELQQIWDGDNTLRASSDSLGDFYSKIAQDYQNGYSPPSSEYFTAGRYAELDALIIERVYASASTPLRADLDALRVRLQSRIGLSFAQIFTNDLGMHPGNPGVPIEPDPPTTCNYCGEEPPEECPERGCDSEEG